MAGDLPPGYTLDPPKSDGGDLPPGYTLDEPKSGGAYAAKELTRAQKIQQAVMEELSKKKPGYEDRFVNQYTYGLPIPMQGLKTLVEGKAKEYFGGGEPATAGDYWRGGVGAQKEYFRQAEANTPGPAGIAVDLAGGLASGRGGGKILGKGAQAAQAFVQGALGGASRNAEDVGSATGGALIGGTVDAATQHFLGGLLDRFTSGAKREIGVASRGGSSQSLEKEGSAIFQKLDDAGIHYKPAQTAPLAGSAAQRLADVGFNANMQKQLTPAIAEIGGMSGQPTTWTQLRNMQQQVSKLKAANDPNLRRVAGELDDEINQFIQTAKPTMPASSVAAGVNPAADVAEAKKLWHTSSKTQKAEALSEIGTRNAPDPTKQVDMNFEKYTDSFKNNPKKYNPFGNNPEQLRLMDRIVEGSPGLEKWGPRLDKYGNRLAALGGLGAAGAVAGPVTGAYDTNEKTQGSIAGLIGTGLLLKGAGNNMRRVIAERGAAKVDDLIRNIVTGSTDTTNAYVPRQALAKIIAAQNASQGLGNYASSFINAGNPQP